MPTLTLGNPIVVTSGYMNTSTVDYLGQLFVHRMVWDRDNADAACTSSLMITKNVSGPTYFKMAATSGTAGNHDHINMPIKDAVIKCMPTGNLYIYTR